MSSSIFDFAQYPTPSDWDDIYEGKKTSWDKVQLIQETQTLSFFDFQGIELSYWVKEFNNRVFDLVCSYVMMLSYYRLGIPDEEWYISPGNEGQSVQYFPHFEEKHFCYLYWVGFYMDGYYTKYFGVLDTIYHLINVKYGFEEKERLGFNKKVSDKLRLADRDLYDFLESIRDNDVYKRVSEYRNSITHNYRPNQIDSGINTKKKNGKTIISMTVGNYTPTKMFIDNINESVDLLAFIVEKVKIKIQS